MALPTNRRYELRGYALSQGYIERGRDGGGAVDWAAMRDFIKEHEADPWTQYMASIDNGGGGPADGLPLDAERADKTPSRIPEAVAPTVRKKAERPTVGDLEARNAEILRLAGSLSQKELGDRFGLSQAQVSRIVKKAKPTGEVIRFPVAN